MGELFWRLCHIYRFPDIMLVNVEKENLLPSCDLFFYEEKIFLGEDLSLDIRELQQIFRNSNTLQTTHLITLLQIFG